MLYAQLRVLAAVAISTAVLGWHTCVAAEQPCTNPNALGVSRTQEVDTTGGPIFGDIQYTHAPTFLADKEVVLTFDDGPFPETTPAILQALAEQCTKATFFYVGRMALKNPDILTEVDAAGMTIAAHTWSHADMRKLPGPRAQAEIERGVSMLMTRLGHPIAPFFRFPYLSDPKATVHYLAGREFAVFSADVDSWDSHGLTPSAHIVNYVMTRLKQQGHGIVLMHDIKHTTAAALPEILRQLKEGGYKIVNLVAKTPATSLAPYDEWARQTIDQNDSTVQVASSATPAAVIKTAVRAGRQKRTIAVAAGSEMASLTAASLVTSTARPAPELTAAVVSNLADLVPVPAPAGTTPPAKLVAGSVSTEAPGQAPADMAASTVASTRLVLASITEPASAPMPAAAPTPAKPVIGAVASGAPMQAPAATSATSDTSTRLILASVASPASAPMPGETPAPAKSIAAITTADAPTKDPAATASAISARLVLARIAAPASAPPPAETPAPTKSPSATTAAVTPDRKSVV